MKETIIAILPGIIIYAVIGIASRIVLTRLWKASQVLLRFFRDTESARQLMRQAGNQLTIDETDEERVDTWLGRSVTLLTWLRYVSVGTAVVFVAGTATIFVSPPVVAEQYRNLVYVALAVHVLSTVISYVLVRRNRDVVMTASDRREY